MNHFIYTCYFHYVLMLISNLRRIYHADFLFHVMQNKGYRVLYNSFRAVYMNRGRDT